MRAPPGARTAQIVQLWQSGELARAAVGARTLAEVAARLGMSEGALNGAIDKARRLGHAIPHVGELAAMAMPSLGPDLDRSNDGLFSDEEPTRPAARMPAERTPAATAIPPGETPPGSPSIGIHTSTVEHKVMDAPGLHLPMPDRWPHVEAFDAVGDVDEPRLLPAHGPGVRRSTLLGPDGLPLLQWIKNPGGQRDPQEVIEEVRAALADTQRAEPIAPPEFADEDLLNVVPIGDAHVGMLAWAPEAGENFDTTIAERDLMTAATRLASRARPAKHALLINVGDFTHADGPGGLTTKGTKLDMDGRWPRVIGTSIRLGRQLIDLFLRTHEIVDVKWARGNHDETAALVIAIALAQFYEHEPRVRIDTSPEFYHWHRFGLNLIGIHHSDKAKKPADLFGVMAVDRAKDWGETKHRRFYCGHLHHSIVKEERTVVCEWVPTLAASDAWHRSMGYRACRELRLDTFHRRLGMIDRAIVGIDEVRALQEAM